MSDLSLPRFVMLCLCLFLVPAAASAQTPSPQSRIVESVNENVLVTLRGNTHPLAQPQFDRGAAPPDLPMARMLLVLKRSDAQELELEKLLDDQQDQNSPSYHQWLTPDQFGQQFGPSDQDVQTVAAWLRSHGFQIGQIGRGRTVIEFSGTALQVQQAFHTQIHKYTVNGEEHWANTSDPQIPAAISPVVVGVASLHNFPKRPMYRMIGKYRRNSASGQASALGPEFTIGCFSGITCYLVGPYDFATIYNVLPLWSASPAIDGTGQSIAIADISNITTQDVIDFRNLFGLPTTPLANYLQIFLDGPDPGLVPGAESEALLDVEWAGAVAKGATIKLVVSAPTNSTEGADLAALYAIENNLAPIVSESFGDCELFIGTAGNSFENAIRQQASAQGITFLTSSGDQGSATCDGSGTLPAPATFGLAVSGLASSPYGVAVGGTDFLNFGPNYLVNSPSPYWSATNDPTHEASALGYVPETTWNDSCTNNVFVFFHYGGTPEASCNNSQLATTAVDTEGGGGGKSNCTSSTGPNPSNCTGHYAKPSWQAGPGVPADGARDIPDVSLFASVGFMASGYIFCEADQLPSPVPCSLNGGLNSTFLGIGGTSASAPAFAGIMALVNQYTGSAGQGNANYVLYKLASSSTQTSKNCGATSTPASGCIFYDVTSGTIAMPCAKNSPDCNFSNSADLYGVLSGYSATAGYDLATGLGSVNAYNLVHNWIGPTKSSTTTLSLTSQNGSSPISIPHGQNVNFTIDVTPSAATGAVSLVGLPGGSGTASGPMASFPLQNGVASGTTATLAGGTSYSVKAHYSGDGTYTPSDSSPVTVTVAPESSKTIITIPVFDANTGVETGNMPTSIVYGTPAAVRVDVGNAIAMTTFPEQLVCAPPTCPTGNVTLSDIYNGGTPTPVSPATGFPLSTGGYALDYVSLLSGGTHEFSASYSGDNSYEASSKTYTLTVTPVATRIIPSNPPLPPVVATPFGVGAILTMNIFGAMPRCNFTFYDGTSILQGTPNCTWQANGPFLYVTLPVPQTTAGTHTYSAKFNGDSNYSPSSGSPLTTRVYYGTTTTLSADKTTVQYGSNVTLTAIVDTSVTQGPAVSNAVSFFTGADQVPGTVTYTPIKDASGNVALQAALTFAPQSSGWYYANFLGDSTYAVSSTSATVFIAVNIPEFAIAASQVNLTITAGQSGTAMITVTPASNSTSPVTLSCDKFSLPAGAACNFSPSSLTLTNGNPATATLTLTTLPPSGSLTVTTVAPVPTNPFPSIRGWQILSAVTGLFGLILSALPQCSRRYSIALGLASTCVFCFLISCGAGGGGGGGGGGQVATTISLTSSAIKVPVTPGPTIQAKIASTQIVTGSVTFYDLGMQIQVANVLSDGTATMPGYLPYPGTHVITASYSGDSKNLPSQTKGALNQVITGTTYIGITGTTGGLIHEVTVPVTIQ